MATFSSEISSTSANSYISLEDADDYFENKFQNELWVNLTDEEKQQLLVTSTNRLDAETYTGYKTVSTQSLQWPRYGIFDRDGYPYGHDEIPNNLKKALCEYCHFILSADDRLFNETELHDMAMLKSYKLDMIGYDFNNVKANALPSNVATELQAIGPRVWLSNSSRADRILR